MKNPFWRFAFYLTLIVCALSGITIVITKTNPIPMVIFFITWLILVISCKLLARRP
jgi:hypothetical protein